MHRTESVVFGVNEEARLQMAAFLGKMLERPPLSRPTAAYQAIADLISAVWWDVADATPDPLDANLSHPALNEHHPWGSRDEG
jgi:hypothetical protein|tara:strand:- start:151 stop:399 length:249 start_codon:yes stop_codon:yes gene_type:complete